MNKQIAFFLALTLLAGCSRPGTESTAPVDDSPLAQQPADLGAPADDALSADEASPAVDPDSTSAENSTDGGTGAEADNQNEIAANSADAGGGPSEAAPETAGSAASGPADDPAQADSNAPPAADGALPAAGDPAQPALTDAGAGDRAADWQPEDPSGHPLAIERLRGLDYPGSDLVVVEELAAGSNYSRAVATYQSEGLSIRGLLTIPGGDRPPSGWPVIIFNHGYIPPAQYRTTERYVAYQDAFAKSGYITYKSDYRGHGSSQGEAGSSRGTPDYTIDVMNALSSVARLPDADANRIGMWGHSMGGLVTLKSMVISDRIKAGVIWAGVVASYPDLYNRLGQAPRLVSASTDPQRWRGWRTDLVERFGLPDENPAAWAAVSPNAHLDRISGPLQLHHGTADHSVPVEYSTRLDEQMQAAGRPAELFIYEGDDHNLAGPLQTALARSVEFFDLHVKGNG